MKGMALLVLFSLVVVIACVSRADNAEAFKSDDAVGIANCIAEYDYKHPKGTRFGNLVQGIRYCNVIDAAVAHNCVAPCVVTFRQPMREDMFCIDYRGNGTLRVWRDADTEC